MGGLEVRRPVLMLIVTEGRLPSSICWKKRCKLDRVFTAVNTPANSVKTAATAMIATTPGKASLPSV
jgi:hypothetical protein